MTIIFIQAKFPCTMPWISQLWSKSSWPIVRTSVEIPIEWLYYVLTSGKYFNIDPTIVRVIFVITIFFGGLGFIAYVIMALVVPKEGSKAGDPSEAIKENAQDIKDTTETIERDIKKTFSSKDNPDKKD